MGDSKARRPILPADWSCTRAGSGEPLAWGERAHVDGEVKPNEAKCLIDALHSNPVRSSMSDILNRHPWKSEKDTEIDPAT
ncbi:MAG: hypothetical protein WCT12_35395 [Verrucomicrobiota bacterium]